MIEKGLEIFAFRQVVWAIILIIMISGLAICLVGNLIVYLIEKHNKRRIDKAYKGEDEK